jgi:hypothetical protein
MCEKLEPRAHLKLYITWPGLKGGLGKAITTDVLIYTNQRQSRLCNSHQPGHGCGRHRRRAAAEPAYLSNYLDLYLAPPRKDLLSGPFGVLNVKTEHVS